MRCKTTKYIEKFKRMFLHATVREDISTVHARVE